MNSLDMLIAMKKSQGTDDLSAIFDEVLKYEKLAKTPAFADIKSSAAVQKKLPMITKALNGDMYDIMLLQVIRNVLIHLDEDLPGILPTVFADLSKRTQQRLDILNKSIVRVVYSDLGSYQDTYAGSVLMTLVSNIDNTSQSVVIITHQSDGYIIYQGIIHKSDKKMTVTTKTIQQAKATVNDVTLGITTYSILGNNAYRFGTATVGEQQYDIMMPSHDTLWLLQEQNVVHEIKLSIDEINRFNLIKTDINKVTDFLLSKIVDVLRG